LGAVWGYNFRHTGRRVGLEKGAGGDCVGGEFLSLFKN